MKSQKERVLGLLRERGEKGVKCYEFVNLVPKIMRYGGRIFDLRGEGHTIDNILGRDPKKRQKLSTYILKSSKK